MRERDYAHWYVEPEHKIATLQNLVHDIIAEGPEVGSATYPQYAVRVRALMSVFHDLGVGISTSGIGGRLFSPVRAEPAVPVG